MPGTLKISVTEAASGRKSSNSKEVDSRLDCLPLQQSLIEQFVELLFILLSIDHPFSQVPQPQPSAGVRKRWIHHLKENETPKYSISISDIYYINAMTISTN